MANHVHNGKLTWGACSNTSNKRACGPQGQFNGEGAEFAIEQATYADLVEMEDTRAQEQAFVLMVPLGHLIDLCAFNGDMDKIAGYLCTKDICKEADEIREDPPELPPRSM